MAKINLSKQQQKRIEKNKTDVQERLINQTLNENEAVGLVITRSSNKAIIQDEHGKTFQCSIRRNLPPLASGDNVIWQQEPLLNVITARCQRRTELGRPDRQGNLRVVAANVDQMLIVCAPLPLVSYLLLDSYLIAASFFNIKPIIVFNKVDIEHENKLNDLYLALGYCVISTSAHAKINIEPLLDLMKNKTNVFVGQSGVGKSSLINQLIPDSKLLTQSISTQSQLGKHTTSNSHLYHLPSGGNIIDSPGIREFALWNLDKRDIIHSFTELLPFIGKCKYSNCSHVHEPSCAIDKALEMGAIHPERHKNLLTLLNSNGEKNN